MVESGLEPLEALLVTPERWWSVICAGTCCPADGTPYDLSGHPLCAEAVLAGLNAVADRNLVEAMVAGPGPADVAELDELAAEAVLGLVGVDRVSRKRRMQTLVTGSLTDPAALSDADCAELAALCLDLGVRDVAWALMSRDDAADHLSLWRRVLSRTVDDLASAPLGLVAMAAWISGNGALLNCCIARLEELDPDYGLLDICRDISWRAVHPSMWDSHVGRDAYGSGAPGRVMGRPPTPGIRLFAMDQGRKRFVVCGETLIDLVRTDEASDTFRSTWLALSAGGPMNSAVALGRLGNDTHFLGRLSTDAFGQQLRGHIEEAGVSLDLATESSQATSIAVVSLDAEGGASYTFHFADTANFGWQFEDLPDLVPDDWLHIASLACVVSPGGDVLLDWVNKLPCRHLVRHQRPAVGDLRPGGLLGEGAAVAPGGGQQPGRPQGE